MDFYDSALPWWFCTSYFIVVLTSRMLSNIYEPKWSWAEMVIGQNGNGPVRVITGSDRNGPDRR